MDAKKKGRQFGVAVINPVDGLIPKHEYEILKSRFVDGKTLAESARAAGFEGSVRSLRGKAYKVCKKHTDSGALVAALEGIGVTTDQLAAHIAAGLDAEQAVKSGSEIIMKPDHSTRHKYVETCLDIMGARAPKHVKVEETSFEERLLRLSESHEKNSRER